MVSILLAWDQTPPCDIRGHGGDEESDRQPKGSPRGIKARPMLAVPDEVRPAASRRSLEINDRRSAGRMTDDGESEKVFEGWHRGPRNRIIVRGRWRQDSLRGAV